MAKATRVGDQGAGVCYLHVVPVSFVTTFNQGDPKVNVDGKAVMRVGDFGSASCGHTTRALTGSSTVSGSNGQGIHRVGDTGEIVGGGGTYTVTSGSSDVEVGG